MKKALIIFLSILILSAGSSALAGVSIGTRSEEVKNIQEALRADSTIFPGQATGYFGPVTQKAVQKVQAKCNLPPTGVVDDDTYKCIFPVDYRITVVSPNGGENWDRGQIQTIQWKVSTLPPTITPLPTTSVTPIPTPPTTTPLPTTSPIPPTSPIPTTLPSSLSQKVASSAYPIWSKASIDLFRRGPATDDPVYLVFVKHIAVTDLFDKSYSWKITNDIANGSDYVIRISVGQGIMPLYRAESDNTSIKPGQIWPSPDVNWDESDNPFTITGKQTPPDKDLKELLNVLEEMSRLLTRAIQILQGIISK